MKKINLRNPKITLLGKKSNFFSTILFKLYDIRVLRFIALAIIMIVSLIISACHVTGPQDPASTSCTGGGSICTAGTKIL